MMLPILTLHFPPLKGPHVLQCFREAFISNAYRLEAKLARRYLHPDLFANETNNRGHSITYQSALLHKSARGRQLLADNEFMEKLDSLYLLPKAAAQTGETAYDRYPLIQYRHIGGVPSIVGIAQGAEALKLVWQHWEDTPLRRMPVVLIKDLGDLRESVHQFRQSETPNSYLLSNWLPFNQTDVREWNSATDKGWKVELLRQKLCNHIQKLSNDLYLQLPEAWVENIRVLRETKKDFKTPRPRPLLDLTFTARLRLPEGIGLGNSPAFGYGVCMREKD